MFRSARAGHGDSGFGQTGPQSSGKEAALGRSDQVTKHNLSTLLCLWRPGACLGVMPLSLCRLLLDVPRGLEDPRQRVLRVQPVQGKPRHRQPEPAGPGQGGPQEVPVLLREGRRSSALPEGACGWPAGGPPRAWAQNHMHRGRVGSCVVLGDASIDVALGLHRAAWPTRKDVVLTGVGAGLKDHRAPRAIVAVRLRGQFLPRRPFSSPQGVARLVAARRPVSACWSSGLEPCCPQGGAWPGRRTVALDTPPWSPSRSQAPERDEAVAGPLQPGCRFGTPVWALLSQGSCSFLPPLPAVGKPQQEPATGGTDVPADP